MILVYIYIYIYGGGIKLDGKVDKSNTYNGFWGNISFFRPVIIFISIILSDSPKSTISLSLSLYIYIYIPTPPHGPDVTQDQLLSGV